MAIRLRLSLSRRGARLESPDLTSLLLYRVGSSIAGVKNLLGLGTGAPPR